MACLETTFLIDVLRGKNNVIELKDQLDKTEAKMSITAPSVMELWRGALRSGAVEKEKAKINELIASLVLLQLDEESAKQAGEIEAQLLNKGILIGTEDIMIAGIARANGEKLVTRDSDFAKVSGLQLIKY